MAKPNTTLDPALYRASGYDFANLWMNMTKIVIALVFLYQNALDTQLGVRLFQDYFYVFHVPVNRDSSGNENDATEVVTPEDPYFSLDFKPLALGQPYQVFTVEVLRLTNAAGEDLLKPSESNRGPCDAASPGCARFAWDDLTGGDKAVLHQAKFNLLELVRDDSALVSGDYQVEFGFKFFKDGKQQGRLERARTSNGTLRFLRKEELRFGDIPVVQGRPFAMPRLIVDRLRQNGRWGGWDSYREVRVHEGAAGAWKSGAVLDADFEKGRLTPAARLPAARTYEQRGHYLDANNVRVDFTIGFNLLKNEAPRSTYLGPGESDIYFVRIFYEWHFFEERQGYYYYNLSRHIIDPDGTAAPIDGRPDVRVREFYGLQPDNLPYRLQRDRLSGDWHLRVEGKIEDSLPRGLSHQLTLVARDDFQSQRIVVKIER